MGLFSKFFSKNYVTNDISVIREMSSWISTYEAQFLKEYDYLDEEDISETEIFTNAKNLIFSFKEKAIKKQIKKANMTSDEMTLNIIQNIAMRTVMEGDIREVIKQDGKTQVSLDIYNFINDTKLNLHYISPLQHEENKKLIDNIKCRLF